MKKGIRESVELRICDADMEQEPPYSMVRIRLSGIEGYISGFAKCKPGDTWNPELGMKIAEGRALKLAAKRLGYCQTRRESEH